MRDRPETVEQLRETVARRAGEGHALYPQGGRTSLDFGGVPDRPGVAIDLTGLGRVLDYPAADMTITVEAGITLSALQAVLAAEGQRLPLDPPRPDRATLGGIFATNASGPRRFGSGRPRDLILGVGFIAADGRAVKGGGRVVKNVAGYDFPRLLTGSMGTLGVIEHMTLKVRPRPEASAVAWVGFDGLSDVSAALDRLNTSRTRPAALELWSRKAAEIVAGGLGLPISEWTLAIGFEDNADSVRWQCDSVGPEVEPGRREYVEGEQAEALWRSMAEFPEAEVGPLTLLANVRPSAVPGLAARLDAGRWAVQAHAGNGVVRAHLTAPDADLADVTSVVDELRQEAGQAGGNLTLPRCPTEWKPQLRVWGRPRGDWSMMERVKRALDPAGVLNPGRFVGTI
jgi:glycolate oxidase FAD binding subunit